jgi:predicted transcriptional regulator
MKVKRIRIGIAPPGQIFKEAGEVIGHIEAGRKMKPETGWVYFPDVREVGKVLTPKRLEILKSIHDHQPESVRALAELTGRNVKNVADDLDLLASLGLVDMEPRRGPGTRKAPRVRYEALTLEVHL